MRAGPSSLRLKCIESPAKEMGVYLMCPWGSSDGFRLWNKRIIFVFGLEIRVEIYKKETI